MPVQQGVYIPPDVPNNNDKKNEPRSKIQELLQRRGEIAAQRAEISELERLAAEAEREKRRLEADIDASPGKHDGNTPNSRNNDEDEKQKMITQAVTLLNAGVDPKIVGQILAGSTPIAPVTVSPPSHNGDMVKTVKDLVGIITDVKRDSEVEHLKEKLAKVEQELKEERSARKHLLADERNSDPLKQASDAAQSISQLYRTFKEVGLIREPAPATSNNLDIVKETHRHNERMRELELEEARKNSRAEMLTAGIEKFGKIMADAIRARGGSESGAETPKTNIQMFKCICGADLAAIPEATEIMCPKCNSVYGRRVVKSAGIGSGESSADTGLGEGANIQSDQPRADNESGVQLSE